MGKIKAFVSGFLLVALCVGVADAGNVVKPSIQCVEQVYCSQVGVREASGHNDGKQVESYLASVGLAKGYSWCAAFVNWTYTQCGVQTIKSGWVPAWFAAKQLIYVRGKPGQTPQKADVFGIYFPSKRRIAHIGFVDEWQADKGICITVEGNTNEAGSREGDGVYRKRRPIRTVYAVARWVE